MAFLFKIRLTKRPLTIQTDGTYWFIGCDDGKILKITIANNTTVTLASFVGRAVNAMCSDGTSMYAGLSDGSVKKITLADGTVAELEPKSKTRAAIISIHYNSTLVSFGFNDGSIKTRATT